MMELLRKTMVVFGLLCLNTLHAQNVNNQMSDTEIAKDILGSWTEQSEGRQIWMFNADGTKLAKRKNNLTYRIAGYRVNFNLYQERVDVKWEVKDGKIHEILVPLKNIKMKVQDPDLSDYTPQTRQKILSAIPEFERKTTRDAQIDWEKVIGKKTYWNIKYYSKDKMILQLKDEEEEHVFIRNLKGYLSTKLTSKTGTENGHDYVDLGLPSGTLWAICNVGATSYEQKGSYYAFGETIPKKVYSEDTYKFFFKQAGKYFLKKYCSSLKYTTSYDYVDGKDQLDMIDDVAHVKWGGDWCIPTKEQLEELANECKSEWLNDGVIFIGPNGNSIFLPIAGAVNKSKLNLKNGEYLSRSITEDGVWVMFIKEKEASACHFYCGYSVRPVLAHKRASNSNKMKTILVDRNTNRETRESPKAEEESTIDETKVFNIVEEMPQFPGGQVALLEYLAKNIKYPVDAEKNGVQGRVICSYVVERDGSLSDIRVVKSVEPSLDKEAVRVIKSMPKWTPGKANGHNVRVKYTVPVQFRLQ